MASKNWNEGTPPPAGYTLDDDKELALIVRDTHGIPGHFTRYGYVGVVEYPKGVNEVPWQIRNIKSRGFRVVSCSRKLCAARALGRERDEVRKWVDKVRAERDARILKAA